MIIEYKQYKINIKSLNNNITQKILLNNCDKINDNFYDICIQILENLILNNIIINKLNISLNENVYLNISNVLYNNDETFFKNIYYDLHIYELSYNNLINSNNINKIYNLIIDTINNTKKKME